MKLLVALVVRELPISIHPGEVFCDLYMASRFDCRFANSAIKSPQAPKTMPEQGLFQGAVFGNRKPLPIGLQHLDRLYSEHPTNLSSFALYRRNTP